MTDLEDRLTDLLTRSVATVDIHPDLGRVVAHSTARRARRRAPYIVGLAAAGAAITLALTQLLPSPDDDPTITTGPSVTVAPTGVPRYLVTEPGWQITWVEESDPDSGEMNFEGPNGAHAELAWYPGDEFANRLEQWVLAGTPPRSQVAGHDAYGNPGGPVLVWRAQGFVFEIRGGWSEPSMLFAQLIPTLEEIDEETWFTALPEATLLPAERAALVDSTLRSLPLPEGFDRDRLPAGQLGADESMVTLEVTHMVACAWVEQWVGADEAGDEAAKAEAVETIGGWETWPPNGGRLQGPWGDEMRQLAVAMAADEPIPSPNEPVASQGDSYRVAFECPEG